MKNLPDTIYIQPNAHDGWFEGNKPNDNFVEYVRKNAFIRKVANYLNYMLYDRVEIKKPGTIIPSECTKCEFIERFKKHMEG